MFADLATVDLVIFFAYIFGMISFGVWITLKDKNESAQDYFLASRALPWWAVGGSLIASNISTEQILAMNGSGFELGMAIATYEMMAAITLILVAKFLLPVFLKEGIYTMPQFLERRFDGRSRSLMSVFWIALFVFVNISTVLYLGALAIQSFFGVPLLYGIIALVLYSASFSIFRRSQGGRLDGCRPGSCPRNWRLSGLVLRLERRERRRRLLHGAKICSLTPFRITSR